MDLGKVNLDNLTNTEQKQLLSLIKKANEPKKRTWKPKSGGEYFRILSDGMINCQICITNMFFELEYALGNCFKTEAEAKWAAEHLRAKAELQRFAEEFNEPINWGDSKQEKYKLIYITYPNEQGVKAEFVNNFVRCADTVYFTSKEIAERAIKTIGEERLIKYYFGIEG